MYLKWKFYSNDKIFSQKIDELSEAWLQKTISSHIGVKELWVDTPDKVYWIISNGQVDVDIYNYPGIFLRWLTGHVHEFPPVDVDVQVSP